MVPQVLECQKHLLYTSNLVHRHAHADGSYQIHIFKIHIFKIHIFKIHRDAYDNRTTPNAIKGSNGMCFCGVVLMQYWQFELAESQGQE